MKILLSATLAAALPQAAVATTSPIADVICYPREDLVRQLEHEFRATRIGSGLRGGAELIEVWAVEATGEWTLVRSRPSGMACIVAMGRDWMLEAPEDPA